jgi:cysteine desulfurase / selenocysteine lyase
LAPWCRWQDVIKLAHARGIPVLVDGSTGLRCIMPIDVQADLDCRLLRLYRPQDLWAHRHRGVLYGKTRTAGAAMPPYQGGGEMIARSVRRDGSHLCNDPPHRFEAGTPAIVQAIGLSAALDYMRFHRPRQYRHP